jgi:hypothetical protein
MRTLRPVLLAAAPGALAQASVQAGQTTRDDGQSVRADLHAGRAVRALADGRTGFVAVTGELRYREPAQRVGRCNGNVYGGNLFDFGDVGPNGEYATDADNQADLARQRERGFDRFRVQRIGGSRLANGTAFLDAAVPLGAGRLLGRYALSAGANRLLDRLPPRQDYASSDFGVFAYSRVAPDGIRGRFAYANLAARL